jgi:hypothetical protein
MKIPRYTGRDVDDPAWPEIEHFANCPHCGALIDLRDLRQVLDHLHGEIPEDRTGLPDPAASLVLIYPGRSGSRYSNGPLRSRSCPRPRLILMDLRRVS